MSTPKNPQDWSTTMTTTQPEELSPGEPTLADDRQSRVASAARRLSEAVRIAGGGATTLIGRVPGTVRATQSRGEQHHECAPDTPRLHASLARGELARLERRALSDGCAEAGHRGRVHAGAAHGCGHPRTPDRAGGPAPGALTHLPGGSIRRWLSRVSPLTWAIRRPGPPSRNCPVPLVIGSETACSRRARQDERHGQRPGSRPRPRTRPA